MSSSTTSPTTPPCKDVHMLSFHSYRPKDRLGTYVYRREDNTLVFPDHTDVIPTLFQSGEEPPALPVPTGNDRYKNEREFQDAIKERYRAVYVIPKANEENDGRVYHGPRFVTYPFMVEPAEKIHGESESSFTYVFGHEQNPKAFLFDRENGQVYFHSTDSNIWSMFSIPSGFGISFGPASVIDHVEVIVDQPKPTNENVNQLATQANVRAVFLIYNTTKQQFTDIYVNEPYYRWRKSFEGERKRKMREPVSYVKRVGYDKDGHGVEQLPITETYFTQEVRLDQHCASVKHLALEYACWDLIRARDEPLKNYFTTFPNTLYYITKTSRAMTERKDMKDKVTDDIVLL